MYFDLETVRKHEEFSIFYTILIRFEMKNLERGKVQENKMKVLR